MTIYSLSNPPKGCYTYAYIRDDGSPYYIGKGTHKRAWRHCKRDLIKPPVDRSKILILEANLSEVGALALERRYIRWYGRIDDSSGCLRNRTDGGQGGSFPGNLNGMYGKPWSPEQSKIIAERNTGIGNGMFNKKHTDATRKKMSENHTRSCLGKRLFTDLDGMRRYMLPTDPRIIEFGLVPVVGSV